jgi:hypothetical protein
LIIIGSPAILEEGAFYKKLLSEVKIKYSIWFSQIILLKLQEIDFAL